MYKERIISHPLTICYYANQSLRKDTYLTLTNEKTAKRGLVCTMVILTKEDHANLGFLTLEEWLCSMILSCLQVP